MRKFLVILGLALVTSPLWAQIGASTVTWVDATTMEDGSALQISETVVYRSDVSGVGPYNEVDRVPGGVMAFMDSGLWNGRYFYAATHISATNGAESNLSNFDDVLIALGAGNDQPGVVLPNPPQNLIAQ